MSFFLSHAMTTKMAAFLVALLLILHRVGNHDLADGRLFDGRILDRITGIRRDGIAFLLLLVDDVTDKRLVFKVVIIIVNGSGDIEILPDLGFVGRNFDGWKTSFPSH